MQQTVNRIRRCLTCGYKTHRRLWQEDVCPVCEYPSPYVESAHGGIGKKEIAIAKEVLKQSVNTIEKSSSSQSIERG